MVRELFQNDKYIFEQNLIKIYFYYSLKKSLLSHFVEEQLFYFQSITVYNGTYLPLLMLILYIFVLGSIKLEQMKLARNISAMRSHGNLDVNADRTNSRREISFLIQVNYQCYID